MTSKPLSSLTFCWRLASWLLLPAQIISCPMMLWAADQESVPAQPVATDLNMPAPSVSEQNVVINTTPPLSESAPDELTLLGDPSDANLFRCRFFDEPFVPVGRATTAEDNTAFASALTQFRENRQDFTPLTEFLTSHPDSPWAPVLELNLGVDYEKGLFFTRAFRAFIHVWDSNKAGTEGPVKLLADRAVGQLAELYGSLGCADALAPLLDEVDQREFFGSAKQRIVVARELLNFMYYHPDHAYNCGPLALDTLVHLSHPESDHVPMLFDPEEDVVGHDLGQLEKLAWDAGLPFVMVKRVGEESFPVPSVVHWKTRHFDVITARDGNRYLIRNPYSSEQTWVTETALNEETTGYVLVAVEKVPVGWPRVDDAEAATVWGGCHTGTCDKNNTHKCEICSNPGCGGNRFMAGYQIQMALTNLHISDTPIGYQPPKGPAVMFEVDYNHREANQPSSFNYSNLGRLWAFSWLGYASDAGGDMAANGYPAGMTVNFYEPGGGTTPVAFGGGVTAVVCAKDSSQIQRISIPATEPVGGAGNIGTQPGPIMRYVRTFSDGSIYTYDCATSRSGNRQVFLTQITDPQGNSINFSFDGSFRITGVTDALGQVTTISYPPNGLIYNIEKITDPFGRKATFAYDGSGKLASITDPVGIVSRFEYQGDFIQRLITPYGATTFGAGESGTAETNRRWVEATDPMGGKERVEYFQGDNPGFPAQDPDPRLVRYDNVLANGFHLYNELLNTRNTYYWDKKAMMTGPGDYTKAHVYHWLHGHSLDKITDILESEKAPLEAWVWYNYVNQRSPYFEEGDNSYPTRIGRLVDNDIQLTQMSYNSTGNVVSTVDPKGRAVSYGYAGNEIDVTTVTNTTGGMNELLASYAYTDASTPVSLHKPLTETDAAGQITKFTYTTWGEVATRTVVRNGANETTTWNYDANRYLQNITGPAAGATVSFQYDGFKRLWKTTDSEGYTRAFDYDAIDRVTKVTYPDNSYEQTIYNKLDPEWQRDRLGRWTHLFHDPLRRVSAVVDPAGRMTKYDWCVCGAMEKLTDGEGHATRFAYDVQRRLVQKTYEDTTAVQFTYDPHRNLLSTRTDARGVVTAYTYENDDSPATISYTNVAGVSITAGVTFSNGSRYRRVESITTGTSATNYAYFPITAGQLGAGKLKSVQGPIGNVDKVEYSYDELGRVVSTTINGVAETATLDALGRITQVVNALTPGVSSFGYSYVNQTNRLASVTYPNGQRTDYSYWPNVAVAPAGSGKGDQRLKTIWNQIPVGGTLTTLSKHDYGYNVAGEITDWTQQPDAAPASAYSYSYGYDRANQLLTATKKDASAGTVQKQSVYAYDKAGNRTLEQVDSSISSSTYNSLNQLTGRTGAGPMVFSGTVSEPATVTVGGNPATVDGNNRYRGTAVVTPGVPVPIIATDASGHVTPMAATVTATAGNPTQTLTYDLNGNLTSDGTRTFTWDAENRLTSVAKGVDTHSWAYNGSGQRISESVNGTLTKQWVYDGTALKEELDGSSAVTKRFFGQGELVQGIAHYFTRDHLGSVRDVVDATSPNPLREASYDYDAYGRRPPITGFSADFGYTGHYFHSQTGLNLTFYRAYDPEFGRWLSRDSNGVAEFLPEGPNLYAYVGEDPIRYVDRKGKDREVWDMVRPFGPGLMYHQWIAVDTWKNGEKTGQVALHCSGFGVTKYEVWSQQDTLALSTTEPPPQMREHIRSTPMDDMALVNKWLEWQDNPHSGPNYWSWPTCAGSAQGMKNFGVPSFRYQPNLR